MRLYSLLFILLLNVLVVSCDSGLQGDLNENLPPKTSLTVNEINLPEGERLVSQVNISWWGDDPDGFVTGYEFYIGNPSEAAEDDWSFTQNTDSTFILPIPEGNTEANVQFSVRAVDNDGAKDPEPPSLTFPIRNTEPTVNFAINQTPPDTTYRIASFGFNPDDPDGEANLNRVEVALNDTTSEGSWKELSLNVDFITLRIDDTQADPTASVMLGRSAVESDIVFDNVNVNGENEFYVRAIDNAAAVSNVATYNWYVKEQTSRILFLNDYYGFYSQQRADLHLGLLNSIGLGTVDYLDISDGVVSGGTRVPLTNALPDRKLAEPTINMMLAEWDYIYWISNDLDRNIGYALEITDQFFEEGGKMFVNIPIELLGDRNSLYQFLPFQGVQQPVYENDDDPDGDDNRSPAFRIRSCSEIESASEVSFSPNLRFKQNVISIYPIIPFSESANLFEANFSLLLANPRGNADYTGNSVISTLGPNEDIAYFGIDLAEFTLANVDSNNDGIMDSNYSCETPESTDENPQYYPPSDLSGLIEFLTIETLGFEQ